MMFPGHCAQLNLEKKGEQKAQAAVGWVRSILNGQVPSVVDESHREFLELIERYVIDLDGYERAKEAKAFLYEAGLKEVESAVEFLIKTGFWGKDDDPESKKIAFHFKHSQRALEEVEAVLEASGETSRVLRTERISKFFPSTVKQPRILTTPFRLKRTRIRLFWESTSRMSPMS